MFNVMVRRLDQLNLTEVCPFRIADWIRFVVRTICCPFKTTVLAEIPVDKLGDLIVTP